MHIDIQNRRLSTMPAATLGRGHAGDRCEDEDRDEDGAVDWKDEQEERSKQEEDMGITLSMQVAPATEDTLPILYKTARGTSQQKYRIDTTVLAPRRDSKRFEEIRRDSKRSLEQCRVTS